MAERLDQRLQLVISKGQVRAIDEWRRKQPDLPSRSAAIRRLIETGLNTDAENSPVSPSSGPGGARKPRSTAKSAPSRARKPAPKAKALSMSKEAQIRALREQDAG